MVGLHGDLKLAIQNRTAFYNNLVAGKKEWTVQDIKDWIISLLHTSLRDIFKNYFVKQIILEERERVINLITAKVTEEFIRYGLELETFNIIGLKATIEAQKIIDKDRAKKKNLEDRIKELNEKKNELQNLLLNDRITQKEYYKKREQIDRFIKEAQED